MKNNPGKDGKRNQTETDEAQNKTGQSQTDKNATANQATFTVESGDNNSATLSAEKDSDQNFSFPVTLNRYLGCNRATQRAQIQDSKPEGTEITGVRLKSSMQGALNGEDELGRECLLNYMKNARNEKKPGWYVGVAESASLKTHTKKDSSLGRLMKNEFKDPKNGQELTDEALEEKMKEKLDGKDPAFRKDVENAVLEDCQATARGKMNKNTWIGKEHLEQHNRSGSGRKFGAPSRENLAQSGEENRNKLPEGLSASEKHFKKDAEGKLKILEQNTFAGMRKFAAAKNFAKSLFNATKVNDLSGKDITVTLDTDDPQEARRQIKAITDEAIKQGRPLGSITIATPNLKKQAKTLLGKIGNAIPGSGTKEMTTPMTLDKIVEASKEGKSQYGFSTMTSMFTGAVRILINEKRNHGSNMSEEWAKQAKKRNKGRETAAYKQAYKEGITDLPEKQADKLLDQCMGKDETLTLEEKCDIVMNSNRSEEEKRKILIKLLRDGIHTTKNGKLRLHAPDKGHIHEDPLMFERSRIAKHYNNQLNDNIKDKMIAYKEFAEKSGYNDIKEHKKLVEKREELNEKLRNQDNKDPKYTEKLIEENNKEISKIEKRLDKNDNVTEAKDGEGAFKLTEEAEKQLKTHTTNVAEAYNLTKVLVDKKGVGDQISPNDQETIHNASQKPTWGSRGSVGERFKGNIAAAMQTGTATQINPEASTPANTEGTNQTPTLGPEEKSPETAKSKLKEIQTEHQAKLNTLREKLVAEMGNAPTPQDRERIGKEAQAELAEIHKAYREDMEKYFADNLKPERNAEDNESMTTTEALSDQGDEPTIASNESELESDESEFAKILENQETEETALFGKLNQERQEENNPGSPETSEEVTADVATFEKDLATMNEINEKHNKEMNTYVDQRLGLKESIEQEKAEVEEIQKGQPQEMKEFSENQPASVRQEENNNVSTANATDNANESTIEMPNTTEYDKAKAEYEQAMDNLDPSNVEKSGLDITNYGGTEPVNEGPSTGTAKGYVNYSKMEEQYSKMEKYVEQQKSIAKQALADMKNNNNPGHSDIATLNNDNIDYQGRKFKHEFEDKTGFNDQLGLNHIRKNSSLEAGRARYMHEHPGTDPDEVDEVLGKIANKGPVGSNFDPNVGYHPTELRFDGP